MKKVAILFLSLMIVLAIGCIMAKHKKYIREGLLVTGLNREAFLAEWGKPDKTYTISSEEFTQFTAGWSGDWGRAGYFKGKAPLDVWEYKEKKVTLIFHGLRLIAWNTEKTVEELKKE